MHLIPSETLSKPENFLDKEPAYIFHHFMKCGGTSVAHNLQFWFHLIYDHLISEESLEEYKKNRIDINQLGSDYCIVGHYAYEGTYLFQRYPELIEKKKKFKAFTFIRDPLMFYISFYYYTKKSGRQIQNTLFEFINDNQNLLAYYFPCTEQNYKEVLDRYFFIGITERMQESLDILAGLINKRKLKALTLNKNEKDSQISLLRDDFLEEFMKKNELDYKIYKYCIEKFNKYLR